LRIPSILHRDDYWQAVFPGPAPATAVNFLQQRMRAATVYFLNTLYWRGNMARAFADITFTPSVKAAQSRYGSRENNQRFERADRSGNLLTEGEALFIGERDSFYQATVAENGWPYVQHRGGPRGFLRLLDSQTIGYADFRGNRQYLSVGNIANDDRVSLILMDYVNRARLKIWGRARIVEGDENSQLLAGLVVPEYRAKVERGVIIHLEAFDWNCPQHITPRFSAEEVKELVAPLLAEIAQLKTALQEQEKAI
jgi:uncharacterized protein